MVEYASNWRVLLIGFKTAVPRAHVFDTPLKLANGAAWLPRFYLYEQHRVPVLLLFAVLLFMELLEK